MRTTDGYLRRYRIVGKGWRPQGNRTYVDAKTPGKSADCRLNWSLDSER